MDYLIFIFFLVGGGRFNGADVLSPIYKRKTLGRNKVDASYLSLNSLYFRGLHHLLRLFWRTNQDLFFYCCLYVSHPLDGALSEPCPWAFGLNSEHLLSQRDPCCWIDGGGGKSSMLIKRTDWGGAEMDGLHKHRHKTHPSYSNLDVLFSCLSG